MNTLKILVVEDDALVANDIEEQLQQLGYAITDVVHNSDDALKAFKKRIPDMVILDIQLNGSALDGVATAEVFNTICRVPIIYLTSFSDIATRNRAKKTNPANYLLKPYTELQLEVAIDVAFANFDQVDAGNPSKEYFFVKKKNRKVRCEKADILWVKGGGQGSSIEVQTTSDKLIIYTSLQDFERQICSNNLIRVNRSYIVNVSHIHAMERDDLIILYKGNEEQIAISKDYPMIQQHLTKIRSI